MLIQLTNDRWEKFYVNTELIEAIFVRTGNTSEIKLTTGRYVTCIESPEYVAKAINGDVEKGT
jgi:hypothetical protein